MLVTVAVVVAVAVVTVAVVAVVAVVAAVAANTEFNIQAIATKSTRWMINSCQIRMLNLPGT